MTLSLLVTLNCNMVAPDMVNAASSPSAELLSTVLTSYVCL